MRTREIIGWVVLALVTVAAAIGPDLISVPEPTGVIVLDHAAFVQGSRGPTRVALPHALFPKVDQATDTARYILGFDLPAKSGEDLFLFLPSINKRMAVTLNGESISSFDSGTLWTGLLLSSPVLLRLPRLALRPGHNTLTLIAETGWFAVPTYVPKVYVGAEARLATIYAWRFFLQNQLKVITLGAYLLLSLGFIGAMFFRPIDPIFSWISVYNVLSMIASLVMFVGFQPFAQGLLPFAGASVPGLGFLFIGVALLIVDLPKAARLTAGLAIVATLALWPLAIVGTMSAKVILSPLSAVIAGFQGIVLVSVVAWGAFWRGNTEARLLLAPVFLVSWYSLRDIYVAATLPAHEFSVLLAFGRPLFLAALTVVLMRRMGQSLDQLDRSNETLAAKLAEREAELAILSRQERIEAGHRVREQERQRLTRDLHDGISGHLASIVALSERSGEKPIENAARDALNDLRLVIYSLDLGDRELPLALANFRDRLVPQLQRLGVQLDWSVVALPEVSGVTPGNALTVMRILQEAITNAIKHGPTRTIKIRGAMSDNGTAAISVENDGRPFLESGGGFGLANMRRRAAQLHGELAVQNTDAGVKVSLLLPLHLPDFEDESVG